MIIKGNTCLALKVHVNEMGVSSLISPSPQMGFLTFSKDRFLIYVLSHDIKIPTFSKLGFLVTISFTLNYVPT